MTRARTPRPAEVAAARLDPRFIDAQTAEPDPDWRDRARCANPFIDSELFFPMPTEPISEPMRYCGQCEVRPECLRAALDLGDCEGIWAGTTPRERRAMLVAWHAAQQVAS